METVTIKTFDNYFSANIILSRMQQAGVPCYLKDEYTVTIDPILSNAIGGIKLTVNKKDATLAAGILAEFEEEYLRSVQCPTCNGHNIILVSRPGVANFVTAILTWLFSSYAISPEMVYQCQDCKYQTMTLPLNNAENN